MDNITVTRTYALGDIILASAAIESLIRHGYNVTYRTDPVMVDWFRYAPYDTVSYDTPCKSDNVLLDNIVELKEDELIKDGNNKNRIAIMCELLHVDPVQLYPSFYCSSEEWGIVKKLRELYPLPYIGIAPSSSCACKMLGYEKWRKVLDHLATIFNGSIFIFDSPSNAPNIIVNGLTNVHYLENSLRILTLYCAAMDFMITYDSFWSHVTASVFVPQLLLTSCTDGELIANNYYKAIYPKPPFDCSPCWYLFPNKKCSKHNPAYCLDQINNENLVTGIYETINEKTFNWSNLWSK